MHLCLTSLNNTAPLLDLFLQSNAHIRILLLCSRLKKRWSNSHRQLVLALDRYDVSKWILIIMLEVWNHKVALGCVAKYSSSCLVLSMVFLVPFACLLAIVLSSISTVGSTACINALDVFYVVLREGRGCVRGEGVLCLPAILFGLGGVRAVVAWLGRHACIFAIAS